jgi:Zn finger protein HypA/HybF involved in hydrogenase expression
LVFSKWTLFYLVETDQEEEMKKSDTEQIEQIAEPARAYCQFCNDVVVVEGHITVCPNCGGELHHGPKVVCAGCGQIH